ncbi:AzlC family ABC transporter permease [Nakamurella multipartita]|uniref:AzlC family protein n=1 Tax=Nakamurella multipartita (strain ATCC 700099 / DSM 44233 / CIP 104796 / JCM 9543 / NBRC 105858 / Y-104) TaxID=479431 RepID=C8X8R1_NAKMY|nr:AzlC family ABC transporter permease [Nakamurella multipartita]ACV79116.1 AzlC family protein [Nakamurella multipartita DSM 44233]
MSAGTDPAWRLTRSAVLRDAVGVSVATGAYGISFGAISLVGGLDVWQTMALSLLMFTGGSQFGLVGVVAGGGAPLAGAATAIMLGARNALYGLRLAELLALRGWRRFAAAQLIIDESTAMSIGRDSPRAARWGFYSTGLGVFALWNLGTLVGVVGAAWLADPRALGLDAAAPAAFLALLAPRLRGGEAWTIALAAALVALVAVPFVPVGFPVLIAALVGIVAGFLPGRTGPGPATGVDEVVEQIDPPADGRS